MGSAIDTGQIEKVIEKNILPAMAVNNGTDAFSKTSLGFICAVRVIGDEISY
jgi:hypothetical protein